MPNWCVNNVTFSHDDPNKIVELKNAAQEGKLFEYFVPYDGEWDIFWCSENWGTKWDASNIDIQHEDENSVDLWFETAWSPPIAFFNKLEEQGFNVSATYDEEGMAFIGEYSTENGDECYEYDFNDENWRDGLSPSLLDILEERYEIWLQDQEDLDEEE
jgi:hypothetical protein